VNDSERNWHYSYDVNIPVIE
jgi:hypothetical protein